MKRRNNKFKWAALCAALLFSAAVGIPTAHAAEPQGSITVHYHGCSDMEVPIDLPGAEFVLYPVGERQGDCWVLTGAFADAEVSLKNDAASERAEQAQQLYQYAREQGITGTTQTTDDRGQAVFRKLDYGLYLIVQPKAVELGEDGAYMSSPFLLSVPAEISGVLTADIVTEPKCGWEGEETVDPEKPIDPAEPTIPSEPSKPTESPTTGDGFSMDLWLTLLAGSGAALTGIWVKGKTKKEE